MRFAGFFFFEDKKNGDAGSFRDLYNIRPEPSTDLSRCEDLGISTVIGRLRAQTTIWQNTTALPLLLQKASIMAHKTFPTAPTGQH